MTGPESALAFDSATFAAAMGVLGLMIGSFLNVVIHRLPIMMEREWRAECRALLDPQAAEDTAPRFDLVKPRSRCPSCQTAIAARDNVPVLSWLLLRGRCRHCKAGISPRYPLVELFTGCISAYAGWRFGAADGLVTAATALHALSAALFCWYLIALSLIDFDTGLLPDSLTLPLLWFGIALALAGGGFAGDLESAVVGAIFGYLSLWSVYWVFKLVTGKEGMGYGDFKLLAALAAWLGWEALPALILVSSAVGAVIGIGLVASGLVKRAEPIPFGPYLALAGIIALLWRAELLGLLSFGRTL